MRTSRLEIFFEEHEIWRIGPAAGVPPVLCPFCPGAAPMMAAEVFARVNHSSLLDICKRIDDGSLHFVETRDMRVLICSVSFFQAGSGISDIELNKENEQ